MPPSAPSATAARRRRLRVAFGLALALAVAAFGLAAWPAARSWLHLSPVRGPLPEGSLLVSVRRGPDRRERGPDGRWRTVPGTGAIVRIEPGEGSHRVLVPLVADDLRVSPDGRMVAYVTPLHEVWVAPIEGGEPRLIPGVSGTPVWTPDSTALLVTDLRQGRAFRTDRIALADLARTRLALPTTEIVEDCSSDGRWLLTISCRNAPAHRYDYQVYRMAPDGTAALRLSEGRLDLRARFSPDGRRVVFAHQEDGGRPISLWTVDVDGTGRRKVLEGAGLGARACWSPDGTALVVRDGGCVEIVAADGSPRRPLDLSIRPERPVLERFWGRDPTRIGPAEWFRASTRGR